MRVTPDLTALDVESFIGRIPAAGVALALIGALFLSLGAQLQHSGVGVVEDSHGNGEKKGLSLRQLLLLLRRPSWVIGTLMLGLAVVFQLGALGLAPIIVVQPLGAVALVITAVLNARVSKVTLARPAIRAIALCVGGIALFVSVAAVVAKEHVVEEPQLIIILWLLVAVVVVLLAVFLLFRHRAGAVFYIIAAGVLYGFVATLAKVLINRLGNELAGIVEGEVPILTILCGVGLIAAAALGGYFVQTAYSLGSPDLVIAGLTVVDPIVAVTIGIAVLGEASEAPLWAVPVWIVAAGLAIAGVFQLAKHHPQTHR